MNTILGVFVITVSGQIHGAHAVDSYSSVEACYKQMHELSDKIALDKGQKLGVLCVDLTEDINKMWGKVAT